MKWFGGILIYVFNWDWTKEEKSKLLVLKKKGRWGYKKAIENGTSL